MECSNTLPVEIHSMKDKLAVNTLPVRAITATARNSFAVSGQSVEVLGLTVVFGNDQFPAGSAVYVRGDAIAQQWSGQKFKLGKTEFVFVPVNEILLAGPPLPQESAVVA